MPANAFEQLGREKKARAIADLIWKRTQREMRTNPQLPAAVAALDEPARASIGVEAGYRKCPSAKTWARVVELVREKVADERHWLSLEERVG